MISGHSYLSDLGGCQSAIILDSLRDLDIQWLYLFTAGHIHVATWKPEMIKCWRAELKMADPESGRGKGDLKVTIQAAQSFCPSRSGSTWHSSQSKSSYGCFIYYIFMLIFLSFI